MHPTERLTSLLLISAGFLIALAIYIGFFLGGLGPRGMVSGTATSILAFWVAVELRDAGRGDDDVPWWVLFIEQFYLGTGVNLLLHSILTYALKVRRTPLLIVLGGLFAAALLTLNARRNAAKEQTRQRFLLLGFDTIVQRVMAAARRPVVGVVASNPAAVPAGFPYVGNFPELTEVIRKCRPTNIVMEVREWRRHISPSFLLETRMAGIAVEGIPVMYERVFQRVCCELLRPGDFILSPSLRGDATIIAVQSVYTNLIALSLLFLLSPLMLLIALSILLSSGPGPVMESVECAGFQHIPFRLLRFRTLRRDGTGMTPVGRWISRFRLADLPQLLNVVRGDMALVGPSPVRLKFAHYLAEVMPFYSHRFSVKPGLTGWARLHSKHAGNPADECLQIEYDLFYVKRGSLWIDGEILLESLTPGRKPREGARP
jgi:lipopolysaccharide/colanic/teichoic acid biosynthesis glycosyltransferase